MKKLWQKYRNFTPFSEEEAWLLFRLAAFAEAIGWTILITGIVLTEYVFNDNRIPVVLAGRTHGILFGLYILAVLVFAPSLKWKWPKIIFAGLMSVPPYGTLAFEIWANHNRRYKQFKRLGSLVAYKQLRDYI